MNQSICSDIETLHLAKGSGIKYWCCPDCGYVFWQGPTASSGNIHYCPMNPDVMVVVEQPREVKP
jgi:hypothetical protein